MNYLIANWKANDNLEFAKNWFTLWNKNPAFNNLATIVCSSFPVLSFVASQRSVICGAQDVSLFSGGSHTGEVTASDLALFAKYCLVGHSERRKEMRETIEDVRSKMENLIQVAIIPILCFEEVEDLKVVKGLISKSILVYELSENISSGGQFKEVDFNALYETVSDIKSRYGSNISLLYGGSVNIKNVLQVANLNVFNGVLVGKASLEPLEFYQIGKIWAQKA
ncbi:MAG: triose-phosphate isomerase family protein [Patescibacteria group bacterium]